LRGRRSVPSRSLLCPRVPPRPRRQGDGRRAGETLPPGGSAGTRGPTKDTPPAAPPASEYAPLLKRDLGRGGVPSSPGVHPLGQKGGFVRAPPPPRAGRSGRRRCHRPPCPRST